jgi:hypothetical protein
MSGPLARPSATAVRVAGDRYQWLHVWRACLQVLRDQAAPGASANAAVGVGVEVDGVGNVDDVVLYRQQPPHTYSQVKWTANGETPVGTDYLTQTTTDTGTSLLAKLAKAHQTLTAEGDPADLVLQTNRNIDPGSVLLAGIDPRTQLLLPNAELQGTRSRRGIERAAWAAGANITETELLELLAVLRFETGHGLSILLDSVSNLMTAAGLRDDTTSVLLATGWIEQQVINGVRHLNADTIRAAVTDLALVAGRSWPTLSIATLKPDPLADQAVHAIDWVDRFEGDDPYTRRRPRPPATWADLSDEIASIPDHLAGLDAVLVTGSLRLAPGFAVGAALRRVTNVDVAWKQGPQLWTSDANYDEPARPTVMTHHFGQGDDVAIVIDIATTATADVLTWIRETGAPVRELVTLAPPSGTPKDNAITDAGMAVALAVGIRDEARRLAGRGAHIHLFLAAPLGLAVLIGHRWNRVGPTHVYEDLKPGYERAFTVSA